MEEVRKADGRLQKPVEVAEDTVVLLLQKAEQERSDGS